MIDSTIVRAHQSAAGAKSGQKNQGLGRSCGGFSSKIHFKVDSKGRPIMFKLSSGEAADIKFSKSLVLRSGPKFILADRGYDSDEFRNYLKSLNIKPVIPGRKNRKIKVHYDKFIYRQRNLIERFFNRLKTFRRIATRFEKTAVIFQAFITLASIVIHINI